MSYTLNQLRIFESVARNKSITKAAEELYMTQPAVSIQVKKLQDHFEIPLTEVIGRQLYLTEAGEVVYDHIKEIQKALNLMEASINEQKGTLSGNLHFSVVSTGKYFMPQYLGQFKERFPGINLQLQVTNRFTVFDHLRQNDTDFAIISIPTDEMDLEVLPIMKNPLVMATRPDSTFLRDDTHSMSDLKDESFIIREEGSGTRMVMLDLFEQHHIKPRITFELGTNEAIKQAIKAGFGYSLLPRISLESELRNGEIAELSLAGLPTTTWQLVWLKGKRLSPAARSFLDFMGEKKDEIIDEHFEWVFK